MEHAELSQPHSPSRHSCRPDPASPGQAQPREHGTRPGPWRPMRADMRLRELSLRQDPDLRQELASLARGCDFVLPSRFKKRLKAFQQVQGGRGMAGLLVWLLTLSLTFLGRSGLGEGAAARPGASPAGHFSRNSCAQRCSPEGSGADFFGKSFHCLFSCGLAANTHWG